MLIVTGTRINDISILMIENSERPAGQCNFPNCNSRAVHGGYCIGHAKMMGTPKPDKTKQPLPKKSDKRIKEERQYKKIVKEMLEESNLCEMKTPDCTGIATGLQHKKRRNANYLNRKYLIRSCDGCNSWAEMFPLKAIEMGIAVSVLKKEN
jgi:hypothetical protein